MPSTCKAICARVLPAASSGILNLADRIPSSPRSLTRVLIREVTGLDSLQTAGSPNPGCCR
eukprot:1902956-Alexandrium_andersonii.AAC.1